MAQGIFDDDDDLMTFPVKSLRFGRFEVQPVQNVELSTTILRIVFRTNKSSDSITFEAKPLDFVKTVYSFCGTSTMILFRVPEKQFESIKAEVSSMFDSITGTERIPNRHHWVIIETDPFSEPDQKRFEQIVSYLLGCDKIQPHEIENLIKGIVRQKKVRELVTNGDGEKVTVETTPTTTTTAAATSMTTTTTTPAATTSATARKISPRCIIQYPLQARGASTVSVESYECLASDEYLDDAIIDFYAEFLRHEVLSTEQRERTHIFSVFFYNVLTSRSSRGRFSTPGLTAAQKRHERVAKWTKDVNIFEKDFLIVPINAHSHWFLAIVCFPSLEMPVYMDTNEPVPTKRRRSASKSNDSRPIKQPCILIFDSLGGENEIVVNTLREYLSCEYEAKMQKYRLFDAVSMPGQSVSSPIQPNFNDCGLFVLQNIEQFFKDPIKSFRLPIKELDNWYEPEVAIRKRKDIAELIQRLISTHGTGFPIENLPQIELPE